MDFIVLIFLLSLLLFLIGIIKPSLIKLKSRKKVLMIGSTVVLSLFIIIGIAADPVAEDETIKVEENNEVKAKEAEEAKKAKEAEEAKKVKEAEEAKKSKEAEEAKKAKEAEEAKKAKEAKEAKKAKEAKEAEAKILI